MNSKVLILGATGSIGFEVAKRLISKNIKVRVAVRNPEKVKTLDWENTDVVYFEYDKPETYSEAFKGISKVLLVSPPTFLNLHEKVKNALKVAKDRNVNLVVNISTIAVEKDPRHPMRIVENEIIKLGFDYVFLRPSCYMQSFTNLFRDYIKNENEITAPAEDAKTSFVDLRDVADVAVKVLLEDDFKNKAYNLTGPQSLNLHVIAFLFSNELNRDISYQKTSPDFFKKSLKTSGWSDSVIEGTLELCNYIRGNSNDKLTEDVKKILKREPISFKTFIRDHISFWK